MKCYKNLIRKLLIIIEAKYAFIKMLKSCNSKMSKIFLVRSNFILHRVSPPCFHLSNKTIFHKSKAHQEKENEYQT